MSAPNEPRTGATPDEVDLLLPWYAVDKLSPEEAEVVAAALSREPARAHYIEVVRAERAETIALNQDLGVPSWDAQDRLFARIAASERGPARARRAGKAIGERFAVWLAGLSPGALAWSGAAAALVIAIQAGFLIDAYRPRSELGYETASGPSQGAVAPGRFMLVAFAPTATVAQIEVLLRETGTVIVDGPRAGGLYRLRLAESAEGHASIAGERLRATPNVIMLLIPEGSTP